MDLGGWLRAIGLGQHESNFRDNAIDFDILPELSDADLEKIGLPLGHRKRILKAISALAKSDDPQLQAETAFASEAERRQVTVLFSDLVGSTSLSTRMDPEDLREVISAYQGCVLKIVDQHGGFVAKYMGDGVLVYFGYPHAHEDDAERSVRAGLEIAAGVASLNTLTALQTRIGIGTGLVVVGDLIGAGSAREQTIVGETPNLAARLQSIAEPNTVVVADSTRKLVGNVFEFEDLGYQELKGIAGPARAWKALRESSVQSRFEAHHSFELGRLVGRDEELELFLRRWSKAEGGQGQVALLAGEPGIGKSRLTAATIEKLSPKLHFLIQYFCSPQHTASSLFPVSSQIAREAGLTSADSVDARLNKVAELLASTSATPEDVALLAELLSISTASNRLNETLSAQQRRRMTMEALIRRIIDLSLQRPILIVLEDAHWIDPTTYELISQLIKELRTLRVMMIITFRPDFLPPWTGDSHVTNLTLRRLGNGEAASMIAALVGNDTLPVNLLSEIVERTDGIPLFVEEMTKALLEAKSSEGMNAIATRSSSPSLGIPVSLQAPLIARLDRLGTAKAVVQVAAVLGREFSYDLLASVAGLSHPALSLAIDKLVGAGLLFRSGGGQNVKFVFKHALIQDAAVSTLLRDRRVQLHHRIAASLRNLRKDGEQRNPEILAHHLQEAGDWEEALAEWREAGEAAMSRAACQEAVAHFNSAVECTNRLGEHSNRYELIASFHLAIANALIQAEGYRSERLGQALENARVAASKAEQVSLECEVVLTLGPFYFANGRNLELLEFANDQLRRKADRLAPTHLNGLWFVIGCSHFNRGEHKLAIDALRNGRALLSELFSGPRVLLGGGDQRIGTQFYFMRTLIALGCTTEAVDSTKVFLKTIGPIQNPFDLTWALMMECELNVLLGQDAIALQNAIEIVTISERHDFKARRGNGLIWRGIARARLGEIDRGIDDVREGVRIWLGSGVVFHSPERISALCDLLVGIGDLDEASRLLDEADALMEGTDEACFLAECLRIRARISIGRGNLTEAVDLFEGSIALSQKQGARLFELRATIQLVPVLLQLQRERQREVKARLRSLLDVVDTKYEIVEVHSAKRILASLD